jgi:hypothetical protein
MATLELLVTGLNQQITELAAVQSTAISQLAAQHDETDDSEPPQPAAPMSSPFPPAGNGQDLGHTQPAGSATSRRDTKTPLRQLRERAGRAHPLMFEMW